MPAPDRQQFVASLYPIARAYAASTGIPAAVFLAIAAHESNFGNAPGNMLFGIKGPGARLATYEVEGGRDVPQTASFATYGSPQAAFQGFVDLVSRGRYAPAWQHLQETGDWRGFLRGINDAGYATDPTWANKIASFTTSTIAPMVQSLGPGVAEAAELDTGPQQAGGAAMAQNAPTGSPTQQRFDAVVAAKGDPISIVPRDPEITTEVDEVNFLGDPTGKKTTRKTPNPTPTYRYTFRDGTYLDVKSSQAGAGEHQLVGGTALGSVARAETAATQAPHVVTVDGKPFVWDEGAQAFTPAPGLPTTAAPRTGANKQVVTRGGKAYIWDPETGAFTPAQGLPDEPGKRTTHVVGGRAYTLDENGNVVGTADLRSPEEIEAGQLELAGKRQALMPRQQQMLQGHLDTVKYIQGMLERGEIDQPQADAYVAASKAAMQAGLRGTTPFQEAQEQRLAEQNRQELGTRLLTQRLSSGTSLASSLLSASTNLASRAVFRPGQTTLGPSPMAGLLPLLNELQGGPQITPYARGLLMGAQTPPPDTPAALPAGL